MTVKRGAIFDMDGVLVDSEHTHFLSWQQALQKWNRISSLTADEYPHFVGQPSSQIAKTLAEKFCIDSHEGLRNEKKHRYRELQNGGIAPVKGVVEFVKQLKQKKFKLAVASAAKREEILLNLKYIGLEDVFDSVVSGTDDLSAYRDPEGTNKPKPYVYLEAARQLCLEPSQCIAFEDSSTGIAAATTAGIYTYALRHPYTSNHDFSRANKVIQSFSEASFLLLNL